MNIIFIRSSSSSLHNLYSNSSCNNISSSQIFCGRSIFKHKSLS